MESVQEDIRNLDMDLEEHQGKIEALFIAMHNSISTDVAKAHLLLASVHNNSCAVCCTSLVFIHVHRWYI